MERALLSARGKGAASAIAPASVPLVRFAGSWIRTELYLEFGGEVSQSPGPAGARGKRVRDEFFGRLTKTPRGFEES